MTIFWNEAIAYHNIVHKDHAALNWDNVSHCSLFGVSNTFQSIIIIMIMKIIIRRMSLLNRAPAAVQLWTNIISGTHPR